MIYRAILLRSQEFSSGAGGFPFEVPLELRSSARLGTGNLEPWLGGPRALGDRKPPPNLMIEEGIKPLLEHSIPRHQAPKRHSNCRPCTN